MFSSYIHLFLCVLVYVSQSCTCEPISAPMLVLSSPGEAEHADVLVKWVHDTLELSCELRGDAAPRGYEWSYVADTGSPGAERPFKIEPAVGTGGSKLLKTDLQVSDSGQYTCSAPPFSVTKYILVQNTDGLPLSMPRFARPDLNSNGVVGNGNGVVDNENEVAGNEDGVIENANYANRNVHNGVNNIAHGNNNVFNGNNNFISGNNNVINRHDNYISGSNNVITGSDVVVFGDRNVVNGDGNILLGNGVVINGHNNIVAASNTVVNGNGLRI